MSGRVGLDQRIAWRLGKTIASWWFQRFLPLGAAVTSVSRHACLNSGAHFVVSTPLKNMLVKMEIFPNFRGENKTSLKLPPRIAFTIHINKPAEKPPVDGRNFQKPTGIIKIMRHSKHQQEFFVHPINQKNMCFLIHSNLHWMLHPQNLTWNLKMMVSKRNFLF